MLENYINNNTIKENKYKILRMSLILGTDSNREETLTSFEESAREIDAMNDETYLKEIEAKFYDTLKLEEEEQKLAVLVDYIGGRVEQRISLLSDFANITGYDLSGLPPIKYYDKLDDYKERLKYIREYLSNTDQINQLDTEIEESAQKLKEAYESKATSEEYNEHSEEIILSKFVNLIKNIPGFKDITIENIDEAINNIIFSVEESKKSLDIFSKSYNTLKGSGISFEEENEYKSYVDNAKEVYYDNKEQEYLLRIYKLLFTKEIEYNQLILKREAINEMLYQRMELRNELEISSSDSLNSLYDLLDRQYKDIEQQRNNIDSIEYLNKLIEVKKEERNILEQANQKVEILSLLREFCIIDTYEGFEDTIVTPDYEELTTNDTTSNDTTAEEIIASLETEPVPEQEEIIIPADLFMPTNNIAPVSSLTEEILKDNQVVSVENATNLDIALIQSKASKVMKRVGEMLGIKTEETTIMSVTNEKITTQTPVVNPFIETTPISEESKAPVVEEEKKEPSLDIPSLDFSLSSSPLSVENPLFNNNIEGTAENSVDPEDNNDFWFPSDMPDALNDLPDLEVSTDNFFGSNDIPDLNFPDLKIDFGSNDMEEK